MNSGTEGAAAGGADNAGAAAGGGALSLDSPFDVNLVPEAQRGGFGDAKFGKVGDLVSFALDAQTRAASAGQFNKDLKLDPAAFPPEYAKIFGAKKIETVGALADMAFNGEKLVGTLGNNPMPKPQAGKLGEWMAGNKEALGIPEKPDGYEWTPPKMPDGVDFDAESLAAFKDYALKNNVPKEMFPALADFGANMRIQMIQQAQDKLSSDAETGSKALQTEWGGDFEKNRQIALFAAENLKVPREMIDFLSNAKLADKSFGAAETIKWLHGLGAKMEGATTINGEVTGQATAKGHAQAQLDARQSNVEQQKAYTERSHPGHEAEKNERERLNKIIHGS